jgi:hypothetical protein
MRDFVPELVGSRTIAVDLLIDLQLSSAYLWRCL